MVILTRPYCLIVIFRSDVVYVKGKLALSATKSHCDRLKHTCI